MAGSAMATTRTSMTDRSKHDSSEHAGQTLRRLLVVASVAVLLGVIPLLSGLVGSLILYVITRGTHRRLSRLVPARVSAFAIALAVFGLLLVPGAWLISTIVAEGSDAVRSWHPGDTLTWLAQTPLGGLDITKEIANAAGSVVTWLSGRAFAIFGSVTSTILNVVIALFGLYYLLLEGPALWTRTKRLLPVSDRVAELLASRFVEVTEALLLGTVFTAILQGTIIGFAFALIGFRPAAVWGFVTGCVSVLPLLGSALVWLPGVGVLLIQHRVGAAVGLAVLGAGLASNIDNVVRLFLYRRVSGIHPMLTLVGAFAGVKLLGVIGAFLGPLILSYLFELVKVYEDTLMDGANREERGVEASPLKTPSVSDATASGAET
jgi:predicted PurR-regulated permease PerM